MSDKAFTHKTAENAKPGDKPYKLSTGRGFYLLVMPTGGKLWRYDYRLDGKRKTAALGSFPDVSLKEATEKVAAYRRLIHAGKDPIAEKKRVKVQKEQQAAEQARTFEAVAREWFEKRAEDNQTDTGNSSGTGWKTSFSRHWETAPFPNWKRRIFLTLCVRLRNAAR